MTRRSLVRDMRSRFKFSEPGHVTYKSTGVKKRIMFALGRSVPKYEGFTIVCRRLHCLWYFNVENEHVT